MSLLETLKKVGDDLYKEVPEISETSVIEDLGYDSDNNKSYRWKTLSLPVDPDDEELGLEFDVDFRISPVTSVDEAYNPPRYLTATLYLIGGVDQDNRPVLPKTGVLYSELNAYNANEPGVKFLYEEATDDPKNESWIVIETDVKLDERDEVNEEQLKDALRRLLDCAEFYYQELENRVNSLKRA